MKIGVVGCGALGGFYGAKLAVSGADVHFLLRSDYEVVRREGLKILSFEGDFHLEPRCAKDPNQIGHCDLVLIGLKTTANAEFQRLVSPLAGPNTAILTLQNGLGNEEALARLFGGERILGGLCFVCLNRIQPGVIHHISYGQVAIGEFQRMPCQRTEQIALLFQRAGIQCSLAENLESAHWEKLVWNIPFNGLGVASSAGYDAVATGVVEHGAALGPCLPTDQLLVDARWLGVVRELMLEVIHTATALGHSVSEALAGQYIARTRLMGAYKASTVLDFERGQPLELESLFLEPLRRAERSGTPTPRLRALCQVLRRIDPGNS